MAEDRLAQIEKKLAELEKKLDEEVENRKKLARAVLKLVDKFDAHIKGELTLDDIQHCVNKVNEFLGVIQGLSIPGSAGEQGNLLSLLAMMMRQQGQQAEPKIERLDSEKSKKLRELLDEGESEGNE